MHTAKYQTYDLRDKKVAIIGAGSSAAQVFPSVQPIVKRMYSFIKSPTWITAGFAQRFAGPSGGNFSCTFMHLCRGATRLWGWDGIMRLHNLIISDSESQKEILKSKPDAYLEYRKMIEAGIGQRFRFLLNNGPETTQARRFSEYEMR
jgi:hypothetical protein